MKTKIWIFALGALLASNSLLAQDENDDMYFFTTDRKEIKTEAKDAFVADEVSSIARFDENSNYSGQPTKSIERLETSYKPTYSLYNTDYTTYQSGFSPSFLTRNTTTVLASSQSFGSSLNWYYLGQDGWGNNLYYNPNRNFNNVVVLGNTGVNAWSGNNNVVPSFNNNIGFGYASSWGSSSNVGVGSAGGFSNSNSGYYCPPSPNFVGGNSIWTPNRNNTPVSPSSPANAVRPGRSSSNTIATRGGSSVRSGRGGVSSVASRTSWGSSSFGNGRSSSNNNYGGSRSSYSSGRRTTSSGSTSFSSGSSRSSSSTVRTSSSSSSRSSSGGRSSSSTSRPRK